MQKVNEIFGLLSPKQLTTLDNKTLREEAATTLTNLYPHDLKKDELAVEIESFKYSVIEFFNSLELSGVPSDKLRLKVGVPVLLIRNLDVPILRNGVRLQIAYLGQNVVLATVMTDIGRGESVLIPRIAIIPKDFPSQFKRLTIPFKISICQSQGQTLKRTGVQLEKPYFPHGQPSVACSRVSIPQNLYIRAKNVNQKNVVYKTLLA
ncbi:hypothetical protein AVEN_29019-1 [Araneus ventricosus]|uniref:DNA helicase Pif1-like 2B domain-containing protein n=1 Tax=Araneus ventricosus TaxID=182803 RepID=A0A4Y2AL60_ARAVE|nr:hypothetical protein AVEN_29019-1 [Araneus ventricosus]